MIDRIYRINIRITFGTPPIIIRPIHSSSVDHKATETFSHTLKNNGQGLRWPCPLVILELARSQMKNWRPLKRFVEIKPTKFYDSCNVLVLYFYTEFAHNFRKQLLLITAWSCTRKTRMGSADTIEEVEIKPCSACWNLDWRDKAAGDYSKLAPNGCCTISDLKNCLCFRWYWMKGACNHWCAIL